MVEVSLRIIPSLSHRYSQFLTLVSLLFSKTRLKPGVAYIQGGITKEAYTRV